MLAWFSGCVVRADPDERRRHAPGTQIAPKIRPLGPHRARTALIEIENTHNMAGGTVYPLEVIHEICDHAHERGFKVHMDGARVFNAAEASGKPVREIVAKVDTVMFCLSKALGAPVGSMLAGTADDDRARAPLSQAAGRRHAAGGRAGGGGIDRAGTEARAIWAKIIATRA